MATGKITGYMFFSFCIGFCQLFDKSPCIWNYIHCVSIFNKIL